MDGRIAAESDDCECYLQFASTLTDSEASRRSTQKRQKQYFEQKKRQQQQSAGADGYADDITVDGIHRKEHRSLDILSFLNLSTTPNECGSSLPSSSKCVKFSVARFYKQCIRDVQNALRNDARHAIKIEGFVFKCYKDLNYEKKSMCQADNKRIHSLASSGNRNGRSRGQFKNEVSYAKESTHNYSQCSHSSIFCGSKRSEHVRLSTPICKFGMPSANHQAEIVSPKKNLFSAPQNHDSRANDKKIDDWNAAAEQESSVFDLLGDDGRDGHLGRSPVREAHVAFSVEGLGKVGTETPVHSPKGLGGVSSDHPSVHWNNGRQHNSSKNRNHVLGDLELKLDEIMQDIDLPASNRASRFAVGSMDSRGNNMQKFYNVEQHVQDDGTTSRFMDDESLHNPSSDEFVHEREKDVSWKKWSGQIDESSTDFLKYGDNKMSDYCSESPHLLKKRVKSKTTNFHITEPPPEHRSSESGHEFKHSFGDPLLRRNFDFGDIDGRVDWAGCVTEDAKDNLSFLSEESCSSSAVRGETYLTPNLRHGSTRRSSNICGNIGNEYSMDDIMYESNRTSSRTYDNIGNECSMDDIRYGSNRISGNTYDNIGNGCSMDDIRYGSNRISGNTFDNIGNECSMDDIRYGSNRISGNTFDNIGNECSMDDIRYGSNRISSNRYGNIRNEYSLDDIFPVEKWKKDWGDTRNGVHAFGPGKFTRTPIPSKSNQPRNLSSTVQEEIGATHSWLFGEGCNSAGESSGFKSFSQSKRVQGFNLWTEDCLGEFSVREPLVDSRSSFDKWKHGESMTENSAFRQPFGRGNSPDSPVYKKTNFVPHTRGSSPYYATKGTLPDLSHAAGPRSPESPAYKKTSFVPDTWDSSPNSATKGTFPDLPHAAGPRSPVSPAYKKTSFVPDTWDSSPNSATKGTFPDIPHAAADPSETDLQDLSGQGSVSVDEETKPELQKVNDRFEPRKEEFIDKCESFSDSEDSELMDTLLPDIKDQKSKEANKGTTETAGSLRTTHSAEHTGETSSSVKTPDNSKNHECENGYKHNAEAPLSNQIGTADLYTGMNPKSEDKKLLSNVFDSDLSTGVDTKSGEGKLLNKVFHSDLSTGIDASSREGKHLSKVFDSDLSTGINARSGEGKYLSKVFHSNLPTGIDAVSRDGQLLSKVFHPDRSTGIYASSEEGKLLSKVFRSDVSTGIDAMSREGKLLSKDFDSDLFTGINARSGEGKHLSKVFHSDLSTGIDAVSVDRKLISKVFHPDRSTGIYASSEEGKLLSKVFRSDVSTGIDARSREGKLLSKVFDSDLSTGIHARSGEGKHLSKVFHSDLSTGIHSVSVDEKLISKVFHSDFSTGIDAMSGEGKLLSKVFRSDVSMDIDFPEERKLLSKVFDSNLSTGIAMRSECRELVRKGHTDCVETSEPVMMMESYVLQFLCVQKVLKEASVLDITKKV